MQNSYTPTVKQGPTERTVWLNCSAKLLLCGSAQMSELFSAEHRTFFWNKFNVNGILIYFFLLNDLHVHVIFVVLWVKQPKEGQRPNRAKIGINLKIVCLFVRSTVQVQVFMRFLHVRFGFGSGNRTLIDLFGSGRTVKPCFGRSLGVTHKIS